LRRILAKSRAGTGLLKNSPEFHRIRNRVVHLVSWYVSDKRTVDLDDIDRELLEMG
jgi:hypothetical protein